MPRQYKSYSSAGSKGRAAYAAKMGKKSRSGYVSVNRSGASLGFVPRSYGNPRAITERKYFDSERTATALGALTASFASAELDPATLNTLFCPSTGDDYNNRTGRKCQVISIKIRGAITCAAQTNQTAADAASRVRLLLVQDLQTNAAQLNSEDVITSGAGSGAIDMFQNPAFFGRFKVLKDKVMVLNNPNISYDGTNIEQAGLARPFKFSIKFKKPVTVHFNSTNGGTVADIIDNSFHVIGGADDISLAPTIIYKCRVTYLDV